MVGASNASSSSSSVSCVSSLSSLRSSFPGAEEVELERFAAARSSAEEAKALYERYHRWRAGEGSPSSLEARASAVVDRGFVTAVAVSEERALVLVEGARYDLSIDADAYVALICSELDAVLSASSRRRLVVLLDVRGGKGWPNPPAWNLVPFVRKCNALIPNVYPERLETILVYPLPTFLRYIGNMVLALLDPVTRAKVVLLGAATHEDLLGDDLTLKHCGACTIPAPAAALRASLGGQHLLDHMPHHARNRHASCFPPSSSASSSSSEKEGGGKSTSSTTESSEEEPSEEPPETPEDAAWCRAS